MLRQLSTRVLFLCAITATAALTATVAHSPSECEEHFRSDSDCCCEGDECCNYRLGFCQILPPHMVDKIEEYGLKHNKPELVELAESTKKYAAQHNQRHRAEHISSIKKQRDDNVSRDLNNNKRQPEPKISIYDAKGKESFGSSRQYRTFTLKDQKPPKDSSKWVKEALSAMFTTLNFYWDQFKWNSIDGRGASLKAIVDYGENYFNAFYDGEREVFGNPSNDRRLRKWFGSFTTDIDIAAHELTHGMTAYKVDLIYEGQSGAINEHMSDVFGIQVKQYYYYKKKSSLSNYTKWKIGDHVLKPTGKQEYALRDMLHPGEGYRNHPMLGDDPQPADFANYVPMSLDDDNGGVHIFSGPLNRVFASVAEALGGYAWERAGVIWYQAYDKLTPNATFIDLAHATIETAEKLFGPDVAAIVKAAWDESLVWDTENSWAKAS